MRDAEHTPTPRGRRAAALVGAAALAALALVGCSSDGGSEAAPSTTADRASTTTSEATTTTEAEDDDPGGADGATGCPSTEAVAEVVGGPVDDTSSGGGSSGDLTWSYQGCGYDREDGDGDVALLRVTVDRTALPEGADEAASDFALLDADARLEFATDGFEPVADLGDDAYRDGRDLAVRHGEQLFLVAIDSPDGAFEDGGDEQSEATRAVAVEVLDVDLSIGRDQLCAPLQAAVEAAVGDVVGSQARSGTIGVDDVTLETEGCAVSLGDGRSVDIDVAPADDWDAWVEAKQASGFTETYEEASVGERAAFTTEDGLFVDDGERPLLVTSEDLGLEPDEEADLRLALAELALAG